MLIKGDGKEVVYNTRCEILGIKCDVCKRELRFPGRPPGLEQTRFMKYFMVTTSHNDWGNDSCKSLKHYDICPDCLVEFAAEYLKDCRDNAYIDIEATRIYEGQLEWD